MRNINELINELMQLEKLGCTDVAIGDNELDCTREYKIAKDSNGAVLLMLDGIGSYNLEEDIELI